MSVRPSTNEVVEGFYRISLQSLYHQHHHHHQYYHQYFIGYHYNPFFINIIINTNIINVTNITSHHYKELLQDIINIKTNIICQNEYHFNHCDDEDALVVELDQLNRCSPYGCDITVDRMKLFLRIRQS